MQYNQYLAVTVTSAEADLPTAWPAVAASSALLLSLILSLTSVIVNLAIEVEDDVEDDIDSSTL